MQIMRRDVEMMGRCMDMESLLYGREGGDLVKGVESFKYLGRPLDQTGYDWLGVRRNIKRARRV